MRRLGALLGAAFFIAGAALLGSGRFARVAVTGHSMEPGLRDGDWLIVDRHGTMASGSVVVARDPREAGRLIVKRALVGPDSELMLVSDHLAHSGDLIGPVARSEVLGTVVFRYWPFRRIGPISDRGNVV